MNLSISNIAWSGEYDTEMYEFLKEQGFTGLEIAPTRLFPETPYNNLLQAESFAAMLKNKYGLRVSSLQSIWFGKNESIFGTNEDRETLIDYTKKAIEFAEVMDCKNLVFGCPKNRNLPNPESLPIAIGFFREIGNYAKDHNTTIAIEPNPTIYNTNFINTTQEAFEICKQINCDSIKVNIDMGTIMQNGEDLEVVRENLALVNHIHVSEPYLEVIKQRELHKELKTLDFHKFISIEMKNLNNIELVKEIVKYIKGVIS